MVPEQAPRRGRGTRVWVPRPIDAPGAVGTVEATQGAPAAQQQEGGRQRGRGRGRRGQQPRQAPEGGTDAGVAGPGPASATRPDTLTWQQQDLMQAQGAQQAQQQPQRPRQRRSRPGSQQSQQGGVEPGQLPDGAAAAQGGAFGGAEGTGAEGWAQPDAGQQQQPQDGRPQQQQQRRRGPRDRPGGGGGFQQFGGGPALPPFYGHPRQQHQWYGSAAPPAPHDSSWAYYQGGPDGYGEAEAHPGWLPYDGYAGGAAAGGAYQSLEGSAHQQAQQQQAQHQQPRRPRRERPPRQQRQQQPGGDDDNAGPPGAEAVARAAADEQQAGPSGEGTASEREDRGPQQASAAELPQCVVCCSPMAEVAVGACGHKEVCGMCTLRLRLCYDRKDCPLCKAELKEVIIAPWRGEGPPDFEFFQSHPEYVARSGKWARGIGADRWQRGGRLSSRLMHELQRRTALACVVCDRGARQPFARQEQLLHHVEAAHGQRLCHFCLQEGHLFALEMRPYPSQAALQEHLNEAHPRCDFCFRRFYDSDGLWKHMQQAHYSCHVCPPPSGVFAYFNTARDLQQHMRTEHHMCEEPECADCFVAFATLDELRRHHLERHSARMPRWDSSRARPLQIDIQFVGGSLGAARQRAQRGERREREGRSRGAAGGGGDGPQDVRLLDATGAGRGPRGGGAEEAEGRGGAGPARPEYAREAEGGFLIYDDDLGLTADAFPPAAAAAGHPPHYEPLAGGSWAGGGGGRYGREPGGARPRGDDFPSLATAAAVTAAGAPEREPAGGAAGGRRPPPLVKKTVRCPCGRRQSHYVVEEGQAVPELPCDAVCELEGRRHQLAGAFGVDNPDRHISYFERHRAPTYSGQLLAAAQQHPRAVEALEKAFAAFLADTSSRRHSLAPMPREQRAVAHELAQQYGLATQSYGSEPQRYVELFKTDSAGIPSKLLSRVAPTIPAEDVAAMVREGSGHPIRLTDVAMSVDVHYYLRRWEGAYKLEWEGGDAVVVRFDQKQDMDEALNQLGGGIRGLFRVDRSFKPRAYTAGAAPGGSSASGRAAAGWGAPAGGSASGGGDGGSWTAVATSAPRPAPQQQAAQQEEAPGGGRWMVIGKKKDTRAVAAGAGAAGASGN